MKLHEYQTKRIFAGYDIPIPQGQVVTTPTEAKAIAQQLGGQVVVKSQVLAGRCRKAGGIKIAHTPDEAYAYAQYLLGRPIMGQIVHKVLLEKAIEVEEEFYLALMIDRAAYKPVLIGSTEDVMAIDGVARAPAKIMARQVIDPLLGLHNFEARNIGFDLGLRRSLITEFMTIIQGLHHAFSKNDASMVELNPLALTPTGNFVAIGARMDLDDDALFRHPQLAQQRDPHEETEIERLARETGVDYLKLNGNIGCIANGAGLAMATIDLLKHYGGEPANFLDLGDDAHADKVGTALYMNLIDPQVQVVFCNIFGNTTQCDEVAKGILAARQLIDIPMPIVVRMTGLYEHEGRQILAEAGIQSSRSLSQSVRQAIALTTERLAI